MFKRLLFLFLLIATCALLLFTASAHPGRTDSNGGHTDQSTGEYHYHHGYPAHKHTDLDGDGKPDCPYNFDDRKSSGYGSSEDNIAQLIVYVIKNGTNYHYRTCRCVAQGTIYEMTVSQAVYEGFVPCNLCKTPKYTTTQKANANESHLTEAAVNENVDSGSYDVKQETKEKEPKHIFAKVSLTIISLSSLIIFLVLGLAPEEAGFVYISKERRNVLTVCQLILLYLSMAALKWF